MRILVVEDSKMAQNIAEMILIKLGHDVDVADDGNEAIENFKVNTYDFIFMDLGLPNLDGYEATIKIRELEKSIGTHVPITALTANISDECQNKAKQSGMDDFMAKPLTPEKANKMLSKHIQI